MEFCPIKCELNSDNNKFIYGSVSEEFPKKKVLLIIEKPDPYDFLTKENKLTYKNTLTTLLSEYDITDYGIIPIIKCKNLCENNKPKSIRDCGNNFLWEQIEQIKPEYILLVGATPLRYFCKASKVKSARGKIIKLINEKTNNEYNFIPVYDPKLLFYDAAAGKDLESDIKRLHEYISEEKVEISKKYIHIKNNKEGEDLFLRYRQEALIKKFSSVDIETTGLNMFDESTEILSIAFSSEVNTGYMLLWNDVLQNKYLFKLVKDILTNKDIEKWGHNFKFDMKFLFVKAGIYTMNFASDSMIYHYLLNEEQGTHSLDNLSWEYTKEGGYKDESKAYIDNMKNMPLDMLIRYNCRDTDLVCQLVPLFKEKLREEKLTYLSQFSVALDKTLMDLEIRGAKIDVKLIQDTLKTVYKRVAILTLKLTEFAAKNGVPNINLNSTQQLGQLIFKNLKIKPIKFTKKSKKSLENKSEVFETKKPTPSLDSSVLKHLAKTYNWAKYLFILKAYNKLSSTYLQAMLDRKDKNDFIHTQFSLTRTKTGRLASGSEYGLNLQNIPRADKEDIDDSVDTSEVYNLIKKCFISRFGEDGLLVEYDFSQLELRIIAMVTKDKNFCDMINSGIDLHLRTAQIVFRNPNIKKEDKERQICKTLNFAIVYGASEKKIASMLGISEQEAVQIINKYFLEFYGFKSWMDKTKLEIILNKKVVNLLGRVRRLPNAASIDEYTREKCLREGINAKIQGLASDINLHSLIDINREFKIRNFKSIPILTVHDSILIDVYKPEKDEVIKIAKECMQRKRWDWQIVPLVVDGKIGKNWGEMEKLK